MGGGRPGGALADGRGDGQARDGKEGGGRVLAGGGPPRAGEGQCEEALPA